MAKHVTLAHMAREVLAVQGAQIRARIPGVLADQDPEELHQLRVAIRRARLVLKHLEPYWEQAAPLRRELAGLGRQAGSVRDLDVFYQRLERRLHAVGASGAQRQAALAQLKDQRTGPMQELARSLTAAPMDGLLAGLEALASAPQSPADDLPALEALDEAVRHAAKRVKKAWQKPLVEQPDALLHRLRLRIKGLRYTAEFAAPLHPGLRRPIKVLKRYQGVLGDHQDAVVARVQLAGMVRRATSDETKAAMESVMKLEKKAAKKSRKEVARLAKRYPKPWKSVLKALDST